MTKQTSTRILVLASMAYGMTVAILAIFASGAVGAFAVIGAMVLGLLWVARSFFAKGPG